MAHYARINIHGQVEQVIVIPNEAEPTEAAGEAYCKNLLGGEWRKTSYNGTIRKNFAGVGFMYDHYRDAFIPPRPFPSWILNEQTCRWDPPVARPNDSLKYIWDEFTTSWRSIEL